MTSRAEIKKGLPAVGRESFFDRKRGLKLLQDATDQLPVFGLVLRQF